MRRALLTATWAIATAGASAFLVTSLRNRSDARTLFLPGRTTSGHHQIESRCELCHDVGGRGVRQEACLGCHEAELAEADDSHPPNLFRDPRNASFLATIDGRRCVSCHVEHRPSVTAPMGVSRPDSFCAACHADVARERPSHRGLPFSGCSEAGCHNYHDNRALGEMFLAEHLDDPDLVGRPTIPPLVRPAGPARPLTRAQADVPSWRGASDVVVAEWGSTAHAAAGVNCTGCHGGPSSGVWSDRPGPDVCRSCHAAEATGFLGGKHGMRRAGEIGAMRPELARLPMRASARGRELGCTSCHRAHAFDRRRAAVEACLECHADRHSLAYLGSPHHERWKLEAAGIYWQGSGVSCATCHLPRVRVADTDRPGLAVQHNQNASLRPVETMVRPVCQSCHGVGYSLAALADPALVRRNFRGDAAALETMTMVRAKVAAGAPSRTEGR